MALLHGLARLGMVLGPIVQSLTRGQTVDVVRRAQGIFDAAATVRGVLQLLPRFDGAGDDHPVRLAGLAGLTKRTIRSRAGSRAASGRVA